MKSPEFLVWAVLLLAASCSPSTSKPEESPQPGAAEKSTPPMKAAVTSTAPTPMAAPTKKTSALPLTPPKKVTFPKPLTPNGYPLPTAPPKGFLVRSHLTKPENGVYKDFLVVKSPAFGRRLPVHVVLPASYMKEPKRHYPWVILLGGNHFIKKGPFSAIRYWDGIFNITRRYSNLLTGNLTREITKSFTGDHRQEWLTLSQKRLPHEVILILPHTDYFENLGTFRRYLLQELLPLLQSRYRLHKNPELAGIDGISLGASQALIIGLANLQVFRTLGAIQPAVSRLRNVLLSAFEKRLSELKRLQVPINIVTGQWDITKKQVISFYKALRKLGLRLYFHNYPGGHDYYFYQGVGAVDVLLYYGYRFAESHKRLYGEAPERFGDNTRGTKQSLPVHKKPAGFLPGTVRDAVVLMDEYLPTIPLYAEVSMDKASGLPRFFRRLGAYPSGTSAKRLRSFKHGYAKNSVAEQVLLPDGTRGWVSLNHVGLPVRIRKSEPGKSYVRLHETASPVSRVLEKLPVKTPLYMSARDFLNLWKFSECDQQMERVLSLAGNFGYVECTWLLPYKSTFKRW